VISAIVPAAGLSTRMGGPLPKPLLPWGRWTIIEQVVSTLLLAGVAEVVVITGHQHAAIEAALQQSPARCLYNPQFASAEMLSSLQVGLRALPDACQGALIALADQPQIEPAVVQAVLAAFHASQAQQIVIPSYQMRRGHPICLPRWLWPTILALPPEASLRAAIHPHSAAIRHVMVETPSILADLDTPAQYTAQRPAPSL